MGSDQFAIVTGGSRGIGWAVARELAAMGYSLALVARNVSGLEKARDILAKEFPQIEKPEIYGGDFSKSEEVKSIADSILDKHDHVDVLFNGAGISIPGTLDLSLETMERLFAVNVAAPFIFMKAFAPLMARAGKGHIINVASRNGLVAVSRLGAYSASKFALAGLDESIFRELSRSGVKITTLCPGWVNTDMARNESPLLKPELMIQAEDIAKTVKWLLSLGSSACVMNVLIECAADVESRASVELAKLYALGERHKEELAAILPWS